MYSISGPVQQLGVGVGNQYLFNAIESQALSEAILCVLPSQSNFVISTKNPFYSWEKLRISYKPEVTELLSGKGQAQTYLFLVPSPSSLPFNTSGTLMPK